MVLWNRLKYLLSPQFDIYCEVAKVVKGQVADIGFGTGFGAHLLTQNADTVFGYETDGQAVEFAQQVFPINGLSFRYGDIIEGIEGHFDFVVMIDVLEHIKHDKQAIISAKSMLNPDGTLIISTPNRLSRYRKSKNHVREYAPKELEGILHRYFNIVELKDHKLQPLENEYENPIIAMCKNE
jgi:2-polyprenyl-3-methyl-5-hydroxy-6-metoxy-1,4-benzoquinol methylase